MIKKQPTKRYHLILDAVEVDDKYLIDKEFLKNFLEQTTKLVNMKILYGPIVVEGVPENPGLSAFCVIDYSHISIHTFTESKEIYLDVFSCSPFDYSKIENYIVEKFNLKPEQIFKSKPEYKQPGLISHIG
jgi:S-adenosylmethionine decarboxylase